MRLKLLHSAADHKDSPPPTPAPADVRVRTGLRNLTAAAIAMAGAALLYVQFDPVPAGAGSGEALVDVGTLTAELDQPLTPTQPVSLDAPLTPISEQASGEGQGRTMPLEGRAALEFDLQRLEQAQERLQRVRDYTATFCRRERTGRNLGEPDVVQLKIRHEPFSFYMKWLNGDEGREILYVTGENDGEMLVKLGGLRGRLLPALNINPQGAVALRECRHPATEVGLLHMTRRMIGYRRRDVASPEGIVCQVLPGCEFQERRCECVIIEYARPEQSPAYRKTLHYFDDQMQVPVLVKSYGWPDAIEGADPARLDETTLVEQYAYTNLRLNADLADREFDRDNPRYAFGR